MKQVFVKFLDKNTFAYDTDTNTTPNDIIQAALNRHALENVTERFRIFKGKEELRDTTAPYPFNKEDTIRIVPKRIFKPDTDGLGILRHILPMLSDYRILMGAAAITDDVDKNIRQQFQLTHPPLHKTLIIDNAFFKGHTYDFYKYLNFQKIPTHREDKFQIFKKAAGIPIDGDEAYVQKLLAYARASGVDLDTQEMFYYLVNYDYETKDIFTILEELGLQAPPIYSWTGASLQSPR